MTLRAKLQEYASDPRDSERRQFARDLLVRCSGAVMPAERFATFGDEVKALLDKYGVTDGEFWTRKLGDDRWLFRVEGTVQTTNGSNAILRAQLLTSKVDE